MSKQARDPAKRKVKPVEAQALLDFDLGEGESSDDSDFRIEDHPEESDDYSINTDDDKKDEKSDSSGEESDSGDEYKSTNKLGADTSVTDLLEKAKKQEFKFAGEFANILICSGCLGARSDDFNEIVECDGCGVTVHEGCYGVSDVASESSTVSSASTEPWFCEPCKAGVTDPSCELCPNKGGIFKETEVGAWVHLVCALYVPGVAFSEVERLSGVTLFEMAYSRWGARACALCPDGTVARTGVCVGCDAGLCRTYFHVTCGQREGLLAEAAGEGAGEEADPFYAHCRLHSDKTLVKRRRRSWLALQLRTEKRKQELADNLTSDEQKRIQRKLIKYRRKYLQQKQSRNPPWVPTQKMARMLYSSASAMRKFQRKAECMGLDIHALEFQDSQMCALKDVSRRWHVPPAFSVEFVGYYLERNSRVASLRKSLQRLTIENAALLREDDLLRKQYDEASVENTRALAELQTIRSSVQKLWGGITAACPARIRPALVEERPLLPPAAPRSTPKLTPHQLHTRSMCVPTAAALKMGVGFPLSDNPDARQGKVLSTSMEASRGDAEADGGSGPAARPCAQCGRHSARHLMAACDTCRQHYHLHCLSPPLQRPPKKTKLYGWQCSQCDKSSDSEPEVLEKKVPRRSRIRYSKDGAIIRSPPSPESLPSSPPARAKVKVRASLDKTEESPQENKSPIKVTIKPFEFSSENECTEKRREKKTKKPKQKELSNADGSGKKAYKRSFTSPTLTNTPLMSITPIVADSPSESQNEQSNGSAQVAPAARKEDSSFLSQSSSFAGAEKERDSKTIESSIESTLANLSSDIATYKANRKRRKEKHRSRYSPELLRSPSKHKHKRKKRSQERGNPTDQPHPRITIKIKPIPKPDGSLAPQLFYVPTDSNDGPPPAVVRKIKHSKEDSRKSREKPPAAIKPYEMESAPAAATTPPPQEPAANTDVTSPSGRVSGRRGGDSGSTKPAAAAAPMTHCDVCLAPGSNHDLVRCDECLKRYHFACLEPPLQKNPKKRGYSWHCADCDPTDVENN